MSGDFDIIRARSEQWMRAWVEQDRATLEAVLADDYSLLIASAPTRRFERAEWLEIAIGPYVCTRFTYRDALLRQVTEGLVAMSSIADFDATMNGVDRSGEFFVTDLWRSEGGEWKVCARFSSPLQNDAASIAEMVR